MAVELSGTASHAAASLAAESPWNRAVRPRRRSRRHIRERLDVTLVDRGRAVEGCIIGAHSGARAGGVPHDEESEEPGHSSFLVPKNCEKRHLRYPSPKKYKKYKKCSGHSSNTQEVVTGVTTEG